MRAIVLAVALVAGGSLWAQEPPRDVVAAAVARIGTPPDWAARAPLVTGAFRVAEDRRFSEATDGRSTITRDLLGMLDLPPEQTDRLALIGLTAAIGAELPADTILNAYVDRVFLGRHCEGVAEAAIAFFGQPPGALDAPRAAMLAALVRTPTDLDRHPDRLRDRMLFVMAEMEKVGLIPTGSLAPSPDVPLPTHSATGTCSPKP